MAVRKVISVRTAAGMLEPMARRRLRELASDPDVRELQRLLLSNGYTEDGLGVSGLFDKATTTNVSTFQLQHIGQDGNALVADGVVEEKTWWALEHASGDDQRNHLHLRGQLRKPREARKAESFHDSPLPGLSSRRAIGRLRARRSRRGDGRGQRLGPLRDG